MITFPNAKINIGLFITQKRTDGYHELETIFYPVKNYKDALEMVPATNGVTKMNVSGLAVSGDPTDNLVWKAYHLIQSKLYDILPPLDIYLHKAIPMGAGLGGGSADGAFMLTMLNEAYHLKQDTATLCDWALELGSDCPFFIKNSPQFATGRGEVMQAMSLDLSGYEIKIITPGIHVATKDAFHQITPQPAAFDLRTLSVADIAQWKQYVRNDFEKTVFRKHPSLQEIKNKLYEDGALYASMSGTGSAIYGIFEASK